MRALLGAAACALFCGQAHAQSTIRRPGDHLDYSAEVEPHVSFGPFDPPGDPSGNGPGAGIRVTIPIVKNGFVPSINNSVAIGFGFDWIHYQGADTTIGRCAQRVPGPGGTSICTAVAGPLGGPSDYFYFPVVMQWNFWLHPKFSAFGEPGLSVYQGKGKYEPSGHLGVTPIFLVGGRWHLSNLVAISLRLGYPSISLGASLFF